VGVVLCPSQQPSTHTIGGRSRYFKPRNIVSHPSVHPGRFLPRRRRSSSSSVCATPLPGKAFSSLLVHVCLLAQTESDCSVSSAAAAAAAATLGRGLSLALLRLCPLLQTCCWSGSQHARKRSPPLAILHLVGQFPLYLHVSYVCMQPVPI
jgi:hypothetical protein